MRCTKCGSLVEAGDLFCGTCGVRLSGARDAAAEQGLPENETEAGLEAEEQPYEEEAAGLKIEEKPAETEAAGLEIEEESAETEAACLETEEKPYETEAAGLEAEEQPYEAEAAGLETEEEPAGTEGTGFWAEEMPGEPQGASAGTEAAVYADPVVRPGLKMQPETKPASEAEPKQKKKPVQDRDMGPRVSVILLIVAIVAVAASLAAVLQVIFGAPDESAQTRFLFYQKGSLYLADVADQKLREDVTDRCVDVGMSPYEGLVTGDMLSADGECLFYREEYDGISYDLYRWETDGDAREKIASNVTAYEPLPDHSVLYMKADSLYYYDRNEPVRLGRHTSWYQADEDGKAVVWMEHDGDGRNTCYYWQFGSGKERLELEKDVDWLQANDGLTRFLALKGGVLYLIDRKGEKERIAQDVEYVASWDLDAEEIYYLTGSPVRAAYTDLLGEDSASLDEEEWIYLRDKGQFELPYMALRYHKSGGDAVISERCYYKGDGTGLCISRGGDFCLYQEGPGAESLRASRAEIEACLEKENFGEALLDLLTDQGRLLELNLAVAEQTVASYEMSGAASETVSVAYDGGGNHFFMNIADPEAGTGVLYDVPLSGKEAGSRTELDGDTAEMQEWVVTGGKICYIKDVNEYGGDLYLDGREIAFDVWDIWPVKDGLVAYMADYDRSNDGAADFTLAFVKDGEKISVKKNVSFAECAKDGTAVMLSDYDFGKGEGSLVYFDGKDTELLEEGVSAFSARSGSAFVQ